MTVDIKGHIDACTNGLLQGWVQTADGSQKINIRIDGLPALEVVANKYRGDLEAAEVLDGHASFSEPLLPTYLDDATHLVEVFDAATGVLMARKEILFEKTEKLKKLDESVLSCFGNQQIPASSRIAILCGYEKTTRLAASTEHHIQLLKSHGFFVVFVLAVDKHTGPQKLTASQADLIIVRKNAGYDFGSWACGFYKLRQLGLVDCAYLLLMNDSMLWTGKPLDARYLSLSHEGAEYDVLGAVESYESTRHLQSYYLLFSAAVIAGCHLDAYLLYTGPLSNKKEEVIVNFELRSASFFEDRGLTTHAINDYESLANEFVHSCNALIPADCNIDPSDSDLSYDERLLAGWYHNVHVGKTVNPSHVFWQAIVERGLPFIKKELLFKNPANIPFHGQIQHQLTPASMQSVRDHLRHAANPLFPIIGAPRRAHQRKPAKNARTS